MIIIITTCLKEENKELREQQYRKGIESLLHIVKKYSLNTKLCIVENNVNTLGKTFLDDFGIPVLYTQSNLIENVSIGYKELHDVKTCLDTLKIDDEEFVVKFTGRYLLHANSGFFESLINSLDAGALIRYGPYYYPPAKIQYEDCVTGLIGMKAKYIRQIPLPDSFEPVEHFWARTSLLIKEKVILVENLGLTCMPSGDENVYEL